MRPLRDYVSQAAVKAYLGKRFDRGEMQDHIAATYANLRYGMGFIALFLPAALMLLGWVGGVAWQPSMSDYYFALPKEAPKLAEDYSFPLRVVFSGGLCTIGVFLWLYKGFSRLENVLLNFAGVFAIGVAYFPMSRPPYTTDSAISLHYICAVCLFICMALVCWRCAKDTLPFLPNDALRAKFTKIYLWYAWLMGLFPFIGLVLNSLTKLLFGGQTHAVFFIEAVGVWVFAFFWLTKSCEMSRSQGDKRIMRGENGGGLPS